MAFYYIDAEGTDLRQKYGSIHGNTIKGLRPIALKLSQRESFPIRICAGDTIGSSEGTILVPFVKARYVNGREVPFKQDKTVVVDGKRYTWMSDGHEYGWQSDEYAEYLKKKKKKDGQMHPFGL